MSYCWWEVKLRNKPSNRWSGRLFTHNMFYFDYKLPFNRMIRLYSLYINTRQWTIIPKANRKNKAPVCPMETYCSITWWSSIRTASSANKITMKLLERSANTWPSMTLKWVLRISGYENTNQPITKDTKAHHSGICVIGATNMRNPVDIPKGGMMIFLIVTGELLALSLINMVSKAIIIAPIVVPIWRYEGLIWDNSSTPLYNFNNLLHLL